jgi:hypothetical protein
MAISRLLSAETVVQGPFQAGFGSKAARPMRRERLGEESAFALRKITQH